MPVDTLEAPILEDPTLRTAPAAASSLLTATVVPSRGLLGRLAAVLSAHQVLALSYATADSSGVRGRVEVRVPVEHAERVRAKLLRVVDVTDVTVAAVATSAADA
ncbi:hypothetical protein [Streptacidiphilus fuscans]|uniref:ACT domain-containing protein n=1 Tax=Streptacidiphilus fuscans TaxID=2789292 RepID=A0A931FDT2_9ACTN|nr:hypothetical protein [Streptacidiphilus fuscans]MBF9066814.1 hypothetical protein [Streptacidiphilus fuscans]